jgi:hypothetical protein
VQAQVLSAAGLALATRTAGLTAAKVDRTRLRDRSIVLTWAMRGTLHLVAAEDYGWLVPLVIEPRVANAHGRLRQEGVTGDGPARAVRAIERMLAKEGPLTRSEIAERLRRLRIRTEGQAIAHLVWLAASEGVACYGPDRDGQRCFVLVRDWIGEQRGMDREAALTELAVRYLTSHGPAEPADLAFWSGVRLGDAKRAWRAVEDRLVEVEAPGRSLWTLRSQEDEAPSDLVRLLPAFDEYLLGWKDRGFAVTPARWKRINAGGGWLYPVVLADGRAAGTWSAQWTSSAMELSVRGFGRLAPTVRRALDLEAAHIAAFRGVGAELVGR